MNEATTSLTRAESSQAKAGARAPESGISSNPALCLRQTDMRKPSTAKAPLNRQTTRPCAPPTLLPASC